MSAPAEEVESLLLGEFRPVTTAAGFLRTLKTSAVTVILATNHLDEWIDHWTRTFDWFSLFDHVVCSATVGHRKPQPEFYQAVIDAAGSDRFWFVDDDTANVAAANTAGLTGVLAEPGWTSRILSPTRLR